MADFDSLAVKLSDFGLTSLTGPSCIARLPLNKVFLLIVDADIGLTICEVFFYVIESLDGARELRHGGGWLDGCLQLRSRPLGPLHSENPLFRGSCFFNLSI